MSPRLPARGRDPRRAGARRSSRAWLWVAVPVWLKLRFGVLEVISTLLLNFVAESLVSLMVQGPLQEPQDIYPQSDPIAAVGPAAAAPRDPASRRPAARARGAPASLWYLFARTRWGFRLRAVGAGPAGGGDQRADRRRRMRRVALLGSGRSPGWRAGSR